MRLSRWIVLATALMLTLLSATGCGSTLQPFDAPTDASTIRMILSESVLTPEDLPPGFALTPLSAAGYTLQDLSTEELRAESAFFLFNDQTAEGIMGHVVSLIDASAQSAFECVLEAPDGYMMGFISGMGDPEVLEQTRLSHLDDIGNAAMGYSLLVDLRGIPMRIGIVVFQRSFVGAFVHTFQPESTGPIVTAEEVAGRLDARIVELLSSSE
ncbi:MAG: hypothetical protein PVF70_08530 [Anaerolineales bacterium]